MLYNPLIVGYKLYWLKLNFFALSDIKLHFFEKYLKNEFCESEHFGGILKHYPTQKI